MFAWSRSSVTVAHQPTSICFKSIKKVMIEPWQEQKKKLRFCLLDKFCQYIYGQETIKVETVPKPQPIYRSQESFSRITKVIKDMSLMATINPELLVWRGTNVYSNILSGVVLPNTTSLQDDIDTDCEVNVTKILSLPIKTHNKVKR